MTGLGAAATATAVTAQVVSALVSPLPLLVLGGLAALVWLPVAALLLTPLWSTCPQRNARAAAMLDRVVAAIPGSRTAPAAVGQDRVRRRTRRRA